MERLWSPWRYSYASQEGPATREGVPPALAAWPADKDRHCVFCNLIASVAYAVGQGMAPLAADRAAYILHHGHSCFVCLNIYPYASGHLLILPYEHMDSLAKLSPAVATELMLLSQRAEEVLRKAYHPDGLNFGMNLGVSAGAGVAGHLHMHALPRWTGDTNFMTVVGETRVLPEMLDSAWDKLRQIFAERTIE